MGVFRQLGDPVGVGACLCQHHGAAYAERTPPAEIFNQNVHYDTFIADAVIVQVPITITEQCCVVVNAALTASQAVVDTDFEIERPLGTIRTQQRDTVSSLALTLFHHASWEVLPAGSYTYYLVNRSGATIYPYGAWIKAIASDCEA